MVDEAALVAYRERLRDPLWLPEWLTHYPLRAACRLLSLHSPACRGRRDHLKHAKARLAAEDT